jgi:non-specific serine/threonine protein kinase
MDFSIYLSTTLFETFSMTGLTSQLLDKFPYSRYADPRTIQRGHAYYQDGRVWDITLSRSDRRAVCMVDGDSGEYTVEIEVDQKSGELDFECDCPYAEEHFCKHMVAAALELSDYLNEDGNEFDEEEERDFIPVTPSRSSGNWQNRLNETLARVPERSSSGKFQRYIGLVVMTRSQFGYSSYGNPYWSYNSYSLEPFIIKQNEWNLLGGSPVKTPQEIREFLATNKKWLKAGERVRQQLNPAGCINLLPDAVSALNFLSGIGSVYSLASGMALYLSMLARLDIPVFLCSFHPEKIERHLQILQDPVEIAIDIQSDKNRLVLQAGFQNGEMFTRASQKIETITKNPAWLLLDSYVVQVRNTRALEILSSFPIEIPVQQADVFRERYFAQIARFLPVRSDLVHWQDVQAEPIPRLYLHDDKGNLLRADLRFGYGDHELAAKKSEEDITIQTVPDSWDLIRVHRQHAREQYFYQLLADPIYRLKRANATHPFGTFELRARAHPFDFLMHSISELAKAGFEIYGEENLKAGRINRATPTLRVHITSGIDWFDLKTVVEFGDQQISLHDLRKAMKRGERYVKLADGSVGQIPEEWLSKYRHLWDLAQETEEGFRLNDVHLPLIDSLLEEDATIETPPDLVQRRQRLRDFERIASQPLPEGFVGELRPYQKHGFDWLHFLHEYKFGGILADDMGLGKTVQVLAYLQSQREQGRFRQAALLVVPKSLIANWQRESQRFTPELRFLEYMGNFRSKDTSLFNDYDIVLTTYGTMLRDVMILRGYKFSHIILDESQAIKNPLSKSAKAARLLSGEHRIVMTGTPVENNTFELWSQFAFLNPGLLGNMEYFKREFSTPIESGGDEKAATLLRKLIHPFILRRTKEQVAPELPPRSERIVYTDMAPAQKKVYIQTRDRYRAELLGLIESEGMDDARFRILEGLLRLRQIAIHPALVDRKYKSDAPKFEVLLETLETLQAEHHKALIFSQFVETLKLVRAELDERNIKYVYLDGQTPNRQSRVDLFQNDPSYPFFLISLKAGGVGLNLTAADYVIHLDPWWNPAVETQASDRAHRIGQDKPVFVYKIITRGTVEEKILQLQEKKRALVKSIIATEASFFKSLTKDDVRALFT